MNYKELGQRIKTARNRLNITQEQLAEKVSLSAIHISHIESGSTKPSIESLINVCNALNVTPDFVLLDSIYNSKEYIKDEIAILLQSASADDMQLIKKLIMAVLVK